jgi:hypothetical protein
MNKSILYTCLFTLPYLFSCNSSADKNANNNETAIKGTTVISDNCLVSVDELDSAKLNYKILSDGKVTGTLVINYLEKGKNDGKIEGKFKGDTLFVYYTFKIGTQNPTVYKNPLALLKQDSTMVLGVGQIETYLGQSRFVAGKPIRFDRSRFTFTPVPCK